MYESKLEERKIRRGKYVYNFDETGARIGCPREEVIVVPIDMKEKYTPSPENRKSGSNYGGNTGRWVLTNPLLPLLYLVDV